MKNIMFLLLFLGISGCCIFKKSMIIDVIVDSKKIGDVSHANALIEGILKEKSDIKINKYELNEYKNSNGKIILAIGANDYKIINILKKAKNTNNFTVLSGHQYLNYDYNGVDLAILPKYVVNKEIKEKLSKNNVELLVIDYIPTDISNKNLEKSYKEIKDFKLKDQIEKIINSKIPLCMLMLPGDAPDTHGKIRRFDEKDAKILGKTINKFCKNKQIVATNGPRTGKYNEKLQENILVHKNGIIDNISKVFVEEIDKNAIFFDYNDGISMYKPMLYAFKKRENPNDIFIMAGESISGISDLMKLKIENTLILLHSAINEQHYQFINSLKYDKIDINMKIPENNKKVKFYEKNPVLVIVKKILNFN